jgi:xylulokinase
LMANIYQMPILRPNLLQEATSLGAAIAGGVGVGLFKDFSIAETLTPIIDTSQPDPSLYPLYNQLYAIFQKSYTSLVDVYEDLAAWEQDNII